MFFLAIALGGLAFVMIQQLVRAGWSVNVRRMAEWLASSIPVMAVLSAPIVLSVVFTKGDLFPLGRRHRARRAAVGFKRFYLQPWFFTLRMVFISWSGRSWGPGSGSNRPSRITPATGPITERMAAVAAPGMVMYAITVTLRGVRSDDEPRPALVEHDLRRLLLRRLHDLGLLRDGR